MPKRDSNSASAAHGSGSKRRPPQKRQDQNEGNASRTPASSSASSSSPSIRPDFESSCPYTILGVPRDATTQQIKLSYRKLALKHHPDRQSSEADKEAAHKNFAAIGNAYEILGDEGRRREHDESLRQNQQQRRHGGSSRGSDDIGGFDLNSFSMFNDPFFSSPFPFGGRRSRGAGGGRPSHSDFHFTDPFELFEQFFADEMGHRGQRQHSSRSSGRADPFASDPFFSSHASPFGGGGLSRMMSAHSSMMDSMMSQMHSSSGSMFGGFNEQQLMRSSGNGSGSFMSSFSSSGGGGHQSVSTSTRTTIINGVRTTVKERTVVHPDGRVDRHVETIEGDGNDAGRLPSVNHPAIDYGDGRRSRRR
mmetsp:Transcript_13641/g.29563  ORF Transcript_13641/g.29563 Transcript_13641/m.29563 type:complete len:363 (+) Transcript_13641:127-1215(+)